MSCSSIDLLDGWGAGSWLEGSRTVFELGCHGGLTIDECLGMARRTKIHPRGRLGITSLNIVAGSKEDLVNPSTSIPCIDLMVTSIFNMITSCRHGSGF